MEIRISSNIREFDARFRGYRKRAQAALRAALKETAREGQAYIQARTPVRTGRLKRSIRVVTRGLTFASIITIVPYARFVDARVGNFSGSIPYIERLYERNALRRLGAVR